MDLKEMHEKAVEKYGWLQLPKTMEELAELQAEIARYTILQIDFRIINIDEAKFTNLKSEIADVYNMLAQLRIIIYMSDDELEKLMKMKMVRCLNGK